MGWVGLLSPALMLYLILFVTGIPPLEERLLASRKQRATRRYQEPDERVRSAAAALTLTAGRQLGHEPSLRCDAMRTMRGCGSPRTSSRVPLLGRAALAGDERTQALVLLAAGGAAIEVGPQPGITASASAPVSSSST